MQDLTEVPVTLFISGCTLGQTYCGLSAELSVTELFIQRSVRWCKTLLLACVYMCGY